MTVQELIAELQKFPQNLPVFVVWEGIEMDPEPELEEADTWQHRFGGPFPKGRRVFL